MPNYNYNIKRKGRPPTESIFSSKEISESTIIDIHKKYNHCDSNKVYSVLLDENNLKKPKHTIESNDIESIDEILNRFCCNKKIKEGKNLIVKINNSNNIKNINNNKNILINNKNVVYSETKLITDFNSALYEIIKHPDFQSTIIDKFSTENPSPFFIDYYQSRVLWKVYESQQKRDLGSIVFFNKLQVKSIIHFSDNSQYFKTKSSSISSCKLNCCVGKNEINNCKYKKYLFFPAIEKTITIILSKLNGNSIKESFSNIPPVVEQLIKISCDEILKVKDLAVNHNIPLLFCIRSRNERRLNGNDKKHHLYLACKNINQKTSICIRISANTDPIIIVGEKYQVHSTQEKLKIIVTNLCYFDYFIIYQVKNVLYFTNNKITIVEKQIIKRNIFYIPHNDDMVLKVVYYKKREKNQTLDDITNNESINNTNEYDLTDDSDLSYIIESYDDQNEEETEETNDDAVKLLKDIRNSFTNTGHQFKFDKNFTCSFHSTDKDKKDYN
ncbi:hypothetical protein ACTFIT_001953 [Dictyostelium discoideum]